MISTLLFAAALTLPQAAPVAQAPLGQDPVAVVAVDESIQQEIRAALTPSGDGTLPLADLRALHRTRPDALVPQLLHFSLRARGTRDAMAFGALVDRLPLSSSDVVRGVVPFLESEEDRVRSRAAGTLAQFEDAGPNRPPRYEDYAELVRAAKRAGEAPPPGLTRYLFERDPGQALLLFQRVHSTDRDERRRILWAEHVLRDLNFRKQHAFPTEDVRERVDAELAGLLQGSWWMRLAASVELERHPEFLRPEWRRRLESDPVALVRERWSTPAETR